MIFLDNASTTQVFEQVNKKMFEINANYYYNPSALYGESIKVNELMQENISVLAKNLGTTKEHLLLTSGATESNNTAINGSITGKKNAEYIFSEGEHPSVYAVANNLKNNGFIVHFVSLKQDGTINEQELKLLLNENTHFVSVMQVSNETGAINNIKSLCKMVKDYNNKIIFHCDGVQAFGKILVNVQDLGVDLYTISAHKFHGPKGVGALYVKELNKLKPYVLGGGQQNGYRSGTENVSGIIGMCLASELTNKALTENFAKINSFRNYVKEQIQQNLTEFVINESENNSPYILSVSFKNLRGEVLLHMLEKQGVLIGIGSACSSKKSKNRVLEQMGVQKQYVLGSIRISFSSFNTESEIVEATQKIIEAVKILKEKME